MMPTKRTLKGKHVLVTGGAGFIGSHLVDRLISEGVGQLTVFDNFFLGKSANLIEALARMPDLNVMRVDASDNQAVRKALISLSTIDVVFDLAVIPLNTSLKYPQYSFDTTVLITSIFCELLREGHFETLVHFSSSEAYGSAKTVPMSEDHPLDPHTPYAAGKAAGDYLIRSYVATFGIDALIVRPFNNYGPRQTDQQYAPIIPRIMRCVYEDQVFSIFGDGQQTRDYIYVADTVRAVVELYKHFRANGQVVNIGSGQELSVIDLKTKMERILGQEVPTQYLDPRPGDVRRHLADITLLKSLIDFEPEISIDEGLARTIDFYREHLSRSRSGA